MMKKECMTLRAHHGMCLAFFEGKGYSDGFTAHMQQVQDGMRDNPELCLAVSADTVCSCCPNLEQGICKDAELVSAYDRNVLKYCGLKSGDRLSWNEFSDLVREKILIPGRRSFICGDCEWNSLCDAREKEMCLSE